MRNLSQRPIIHRPHRRHTPQGRAGFRRHTFAPRHDGGRDCDGRPLPGPERCVERSAGGEQPGKYGTVRFTGWCEGAPGLRSRAQRVPTWKRTPDLLTYAGPGHAYGRVDRQPARKVSTGNSPAGQVTRGRKDKTRSLSTSGPGFSARPVGSSDPVRRPAQIGGGDDLDRDVGAGGPGGRSYVHLRTLTTEVGPESVHTAESVPDGRCPGTLRRPVARVSIRPGPDHLSPCLSPLLSSPLTYPTDSDRVEFRVKMLSLNFVIPNCPFLYGPGGQTAARGPAPTCEPDLTCPGERDSAVAVAVPGGTHHPGPLSPPGPGRPLRLDRGSLTRARAGDDDAAAVEV